MNRQSDEDPVLLTLVVEVVTRILYFVGGTLSPMFLLALAGGRRGSRLPYHTGILSPISPEQLKIFGLMCLGLGVLSALFGPTIYNKITGRGRGTLDEVREQNKRKC